MRRERVCRLGGWFLWGSLGALVGVIAIAMAGPVVATNNEDAGEVMMSVVQAGVGVMAAAFLLGVSCHLAEGLVARLGGHR